MRKSSALLLAVLALILLSAGARTADPSADVAKVAVVERHGKNGNIGRGFVTGFGLQRGAIASSVGHDSPMALIQSVGTAAAAAKAVGVGIGSRFRKRIESEAKAPRSNGSGPDSFVQRSEWFLAVVVDGTATASVVLRVSKEFLGEFADHLTIRFRYGPGPAIQVV